MVPPIHGMSKIISDAPCPQCRQNGKDKTGNHLMLFDDGGCYCNRCGYKGEDKPMGYQHPDYNQYSDASTSIRSIDPSVRTIYGVKVGLDESSGDVSQVCYPYKDQWKIRTLPKSFSCTSKVSGFFGQGITKSDVLIITGGEEDALATYQMMKAKHPYNIPAVVSLPNGESSIRVVSEEIEYVLSHKKIILCLDMDEVGQSSNNKIASLLDCPVYIVNMPAKDPNDCLIQNLSDEFVSAIHKSTLHKPSGIVSVAEVRDKACTPPEWGLTWPWQTLTNATYGIREGEGYYIGAGAKAGKSEFLNELVKHLISIDQRPFLIKAEEVPHLTVRKLAGKIAGKFFHRPDIPVTEDEISNAIDLFEDNILLFDRENSLDWEEMKPAIRHAVIVEGCKQVFIDPITVFTDGHDPSEANVMLQRFSREIDQMSKDLGFTYFCFCHLNNPSSGPPHERGGRVLSSQFTGSRSMMRACSYMIGIERNKDPEIEEDLRNTSYIVLLDDRINGNSCRFPLIYNKGNGDYLEPKAEF